MKTPFLIWIALATLSLAAVQPGAAHAQNASRPTRAQRAAARAHFEAAEAAKARADYRAAAREYLAAFDQFPHPEFLYNAGEVHRLAGDAPKAIEYFQKYLALDSQGRGAAAARDAIASLTAELAAQQDEIVRRINREVARLAAEAARPTQSPPLIEARLEPAPRPGRRFRIAAITSGAIGVASMGASIFFGQRARSLSDEASSSERYDGGLDERGRAAERAMFITAGIGAAALATGAVFYFVSRRSAAEEPPVAIAPVVAPSAFALRATIRF